MNQKKLKFITSVFSDSVREVLSDLKGDHLWLNGVGKMVLSKMNEEIILEDMILFKKYLKNGEVLDFGTGSGYMALLFANDGFKVKAVDIDNYDEYGKNEYNLLMTQDQKKLWGKFTRDFKNLIFAHYKDDLPYKDNSFEGVCAYAVFEHIPVSKIPNVLNEIHRVLKPEGVLFVSRLPRKLAWSEHLAKILGLGYHKKLFWDHEMSQFLVKSNFKIIKESYEEIVPAYPESITNYLYPFLKTTNKLLLWTPLKYFSHHLRIVSKINK